MTTSKSVQEEKRGPAIKPKQDVRSKEHDSGADAHAPLMALQNHIGNAAVQRYLAQRSGGGPTELDEATADSINNARSGGQPLDASVQTQMSETIGHDFSGVRVHTGSESDKLNQQLGAKAFTTGQDVFFREGEYSPNSSSGQELIAHELTHVAQQGSGAVPSGGKMAVNAPGDRFEVEADSVAKSVTGAASTPAVQREEAPPEEEVQAKRIQREEAPPEEEVQAKRVQREEALPEEEVQTKLVQRAETMPEEEVQTKLVQRAEVVPEDEVQAKRVQLQEDVEKEVQMQEEEEKEVQMQELDEEEVPEQ
jgi:hypothetical protein